MASEKIPTLSFPFSTVFQQHILDGCLAQEIALVNRIMDEARLAKAADDLETAHKISGSIRRKLHKELKVVSR